MLLNVDMILVNEQFIFHVGLYTFKDSLVVIDFKPIDRIERKWNVIKNQGSVKWKLTTTAVGSIVCF